MGVLYTLYAYGLVRVGCQIVECKIVKYATQLWKTWSTTYYLFLLLRPTPIIGSQTKGQVLQGLRQVNGRMGSKLWIGAFEDTWVGHLFSVEGYFSLKSYAHHPLFFQ